MMKPFDIAVKMIPLLLAGFGCTGISASPLVFPEPPEVSVSMEAESDRLWTGVAVSPEGRVCVSFPRWGMETPVSVGELIDGSLVPFPDSAWNSWLPDNPFDSAFVCVQSISFDEAGKLWVLDTGNPWLRGVIPDACRLLCFGDESASPELVYYFSDSLLAPGSYLNDFRIDIASGNAYITDSGAGGLILTNLYSGESRRLLDGHPSCMSEGTRIEIDGIEWNFGGVYPDVHSDGIALAPTGDFLYWHALTGNTLYRIPTLSLVDDSLSRGDVESAVEEVCSTGPVDGMVFGPDGSLYLTLLNESAVGILPAGSESMTLLVSDNLFSWPDTFVMEPGGTGLWVTVSRLHEGGTPSGPYSLLRISLP